MSEIDHLVASLHSLLKSTLMPKQIYIISIGNTKLPSKLAKEISKFLPRIVSTENVWKMYRHVENWKIRGFCKVQKFHFPPWIFFLSFPACPLQPDVQVVGDRFQCRFSFFVYQEIILIFKGSAVFCKFCPKLRPSRHLKKSFHF